MLTQAALVVLTQAERFLDELSIRQRAMQIYLILALEFGEAQPRQPHELDQAVETLWSASAIVSSDPRRLSRYG